MKKRQYSVDLRERVIAYIEAGNDQKRTSKTFKISTSSVNRWWLRYQKENMISPKPRLGSKGKINIQELKAYVEANEDKTLSEMSKLFKVSICAIYKRLKKLGYSYKKSLHLCGSLYRKAKKISRRNSEHSKRKACIY